MSLPVPASLLGGPQDGAEVAVPADHLGQPPGEHVVVVSYGVARSLQEADQPVREGVYQLVTDAVSGRPAFDAADRVRYRWAGER